MFAIILYAILILILILSTILLCYIFRDEKKCYICDLGITHQELPTITSLQNVIENYIQDDLLLIIIQDDIPFLDYHFYWPKRSAYVHLSDARIFLEKHYNKGEKTPSHEIQEFVLKKVFIY